MSLNEQVARQLALMGELLAVKGDRFRSNAYLRAAQSVRSLGEDIAEIAERGGLEEIPGVGRSIAMNIAEIIETGGLTALEELKASLPKGVLEFMELEGVGPKLAMRLAKELEVSTIDELEEAARNHRVRELKGFGPKKEENILKAIEDYRARGTRFLLGEVLPIVQGLLTALHDCPQVRRAEVAGSARRWKETVGDLDVLVSSLEPREVMEFFVSLPPVARVLAQGSTKATVVLENRLQVDLRVVPPSSFGAALQYFTGSKDHNVKLRAIGVREGLKLNEYGLFKRDTGEVVAAAEEEDIYRALGLEWVPPELREDQGEVEAAQRGELPHLVELAQVRGDLHLHTDWSHGSDPLEAMVGKAVEMGLEYVAVTDHSASLAIAGGLSEERLLDQVEAVRRLDEETPGLRILAGTECDIRVDGSLDYGDEVLEQLDWVVASIHTGMHRDAETNTMRLIKAMENPHTRSIAHPTCRLIQKRNPIQVDLERVYEAAAENHVFLEINCNPWRLDLRDIHARRAKEVGAKLVLGSDAHSAKEMEFLALGVGTARRGWLEPGDLANTWSLEDLLAYRG